MPTMNVFGLNYPPELRAVIQHAERFAALLSSVEVRNQPSDELARAWLVGRTEEMEAVIGSVVADWKAERISLDAAASAIGSYVRALHSGAHERLGLDPIPDCCLGDVVVTVPATPYDATVTTPVAPPKPSPGDTVAEPSLRRPRRPGEGD